MQSGQAYSQARHLGDKSVPARVSPVPSWYTTIHCPSSSDHLCSLPEAVAEAVEKAMAALDSLNVKDLSEAKTMSKPPKGVDDIFAAVI